MTQTFDVEAFVEQGTREFAERGLWEHELVGRTEQFGRVAHVFSSYATRVDGPDAPVVARGVNSIQLVAAPDGTWQTTQLAWDRATAEQALPPDLAGSGTDAPAV